MTAVVIAMDKARADRGIEPLVTIRLSDPVRRRSGLAEGFVMEFRGSGAADDPVEALVQWSGFHEWVPVLFLEPAPR